MTSLILGLHLTEVWMLKLIPRFLLGKSLGQQGLVKKDQVLDWEEALAKFKAGAKRSMNPAVVQILS